jgi:predicted transcriptional regulator
MEIHFTAEQEARLAQIAMRESTNAEGLVNDAAVRLLEEDVRFRAAVREGITQADRGEFIEEEEMNAASSTCCARKDACSMDARRRC